MNRKTARDLAFKLLYQADIQKEDGEVIFDIAKEEYEIDDKSKVYIGNILYGVEDQKAGKLTEFQKFLLPALSLEYLKYYTVMIFPTRLRQMKP